MSSIEHNAKAHAHVTHEENHQKFWDAVAKRPLFDNGPIHIMAAQSETGEDTFLDWGEPITNLRYNVIGLTEAFQHRDPDQVRVALHQIDTQIELLKKYLVARDVIDLA